MLHDIDRAQAVLPLCCYRNILGIFRLGELPPPIEALEVDCILFSIAMNGMICNSYTLSTDTMCYSMKRGHYFDVQLALFTIRQRMMGYIVIAPRQNLKSGIETR